MRRRAQDSINELERAPRGELVIAANEATCIYVLPRVFSEYKKQFPNVQLSVDRSYGARVVEAVLENLADFGITQLPVQEKKLQVAKIHSDEIALLLPGKHPLAGKRSVTARDLMDQQLLMPKSGTTRTRLDVMAGTGGERNSHLHGAGLHGNDQTLCDGWPGLLFFGGLPLP